MAHSWRVRATTGDAPREELANRGPTPVTHEDVVYLHSQRTIHFLDCGRATWGRLCEFSEDQSVEGLFLFEKCLYVLQRHSGKKGCFQVFDLQTQSWRAPIPIKGEMWASSFCHDDGRIFALDDGRVYCLDLSWKEYRWVRLSHQEKDDLLGVEGFSLSVLDSKLYIIGGIKHLKIETNAVSSFDLRTNEWEPVEPSGSAPSPRWGHTARANAGSHTIAVFGGFSTNVFMNDLHILHLGTLDWQKVDASNPPPASAWNVSWIHAGSPLRLSIIAGDSSRFYTLEIHPIIEARKKLPDDIAVRQEISERVKKQVNRELRKMRKEMVEEMKRLKIEINFQKKTKSEIELENMYLREERMQREKDMEELKSVIIEWREEALKMNEDLTALRKEFEEQKAELARLRESAKTSSESSAPLIDAQQIDFTDSVLLGDGAYGKVYLAKWRGLEVAVKKFRKQVLTSENTHKIQHEVNLMRMVSIHPNCITLYGTCTPTNKKGMWLVMEAATGSVRDLLSKRGTLPLHIAIRIAADAAQALSFLHCNGIAHRDIAARNVLVTKEMRGVLSDFGLSRLLSSTSTALSTRTVGNIRWMAPDELLYTDDFQSFEISSKNDVWSFGVFLWEIGTGKLLRPYHNLSDAQVVAILRAGKTLPVEGQGFHPTIRALLQRCWRMQATSRPSMESVHRELAALAEELAAEESTSNQPRLHSPKTPAKAVVPSLAFPAPPNPPTSPPVSPQAAPGERAKVVAAIRDQRQQRKNVAQASPPEQNSVRTALLLAMDKRRISVEDLDSDSSHSSSTSSSIWRA